MVGWDVRWSCVSLSSFDKWDLTTDFSGRIMASPNLMSYIFGRFQSICTLSFQIPHNPAFYVILKIILFGNFRSTGMDVETNF